jgi:hypothetical protein
MPTQEAIGGVNAQVLRLHDLIATLRSLKVLNRKRVAAYAVIVLLAYVSMLTKVFLEATGTTGIDFLAFWGAGRVLLSSEPSIV